jgi:Flp pilus assembly protein TadB
MSSNFSIKGKALRSVAGPVAHPDRYRKQFWAVGTFFVLAVLAYVFMGLLPLVVLLVIGVAGAARYTKRNGRSSRQDGRY